MKQSKKKTSVSWLELELYLYKLSTNPLQNILAIIEL